MTDLFSKHSCNYAQLVKIEALKNCQVKRWSPFVCLMALASVTGIPIHSLYPETGGVASGKYAVKLFNAVIEPPKMPDDNSSHIHLLWSCLGGGSKKDVNPLFRPNHIVPVFASDDPSFIWQEQSFVKVKQETTSASAPASEKSSKVQFPASSSVSHLKQSRIYFPLSAKQSSELEIIVQEEAASPVSCSEQNISPKNGIRTDHDIGSFYSKVASFTDNEKYEIC